MYVLFIIIIEKIEDYEKKAIKHDEIETINFKIYKNENIEKIKSTLTDFYFLIKKKAEKDNNVIINYSINIYKYMHLNLLIYKSIYIILYLIFKKYYKNNL